jgi:hypothetical protein
VEQSTHTIKATAVQTNSNSTVYGDGSTSSGGSINTHLGDPWSETDVQDDAADLVTSAVQFRLGAVYNLTADTYADLGFASSGNVITASTFSVQLGSRY